MKRIALLTSGGDAPGMNAAIRAVTRRAIDRGAEVIGIHRGYAGLLAGEMVPLYARDVGRIMHGGGTILGSARCLEFTTEAGVAKALDSLGEHAIDGLVVIGGNGSLAGACDLTKRGFPVVGVGSTIDNDLCGTDMTIGVDTALNIALEAIDRLKVTAYSHGRGFLVEVMGRNCGYLALMAGLAGGADVIVIPEAPCTLESVAADLRDAYERGKSHALVVVSEGAFNVEQLSDYFATHRERLQFDLRVTRLGHVQRGGAPTAFDRLLATRTGAAAADQLLSGCHGVLVGMQCSEIVTTPLSEIVGKQKPLNLDLFSLAKSLAK